MKLKRLGSLGSALVLSFSALLSITFAGTAFAAAPYTCTWTGATNNNFSTAGNWSGCNSAAPQPGDGDNLVFDNTSLSSSPTLTNDISGLSVGTITFQGSNSSYYGFTILGDTVTLTGGITASGTGIPNVGVTLSTSGSLTFTSNIAAQGAGTAGGIQIGAYDYGSSSYVGGLSGTGSITVAGTGGVGFNTDNSAFSGSITDANGDLGVGSNNALGGSSSTTTIQNGGSIIVCLGESLPVSLPNNFNLSGSGDGTNAPLTLTSCGGPVQSPTVTLSGAITLGSNVQVGGSSGTPILDLTGTLSGAYTLSVASGSTVTLQNNTTSNTSSTPGGSQAGALQVVTVAAGDNQPTLAVNVGANQEYIINGERGFTSVYNGGLLKGTGSVAGLDVTGSTSTVSPGDAPGCLTVNGNLSESGIYQAEIGGTTACSGYDQLDVTGTVTLNNGATPPTPGTLDVSLINGFVPKAGQTFEIINNEGNSTISGTFSGLPEGSEITVSGVVFKISYVGGTGNDVVLTVVSVPKTPDTGFGLTSAHIGLPLAGSLMMAGGIYVISRKIKVRPSQINDKIVLSHGTSCIR